MATDLLQIANKTAVLLGSSVIITDLDENKKIAKAFNLAYETSKDAVLRAHPWNSAKARARIGPNLTPPPFEWDNQFDWPGDCLRIVSLYKVPDDEWIVEGKKVLANQSSIDVTYIKRLDDVTLFDALLVECIAARVASDIAKSVADDVDLATGLLNLYLMKLGEARTINAQESGKEEFIGDDEWTGAIDL